MVSLASTLGKPFGTGILVREPDTDETILMCEIIREFQNAGDSNKLYHVFELLLLFIFIVDITIWKIKKLHIRFENWKIVELKSNRSGVKWEFTLTATRGAVDAHYV